MSRESPLVDSDCLKSCNPSRLLVRFQPIVKILHCITGLSGDGAQRMLLRLAAAMADRGVASKVINLGTSTQLREEFEQSGVPVVSLDMVPSLGCMPAGVHRLRSEIESFKPHIVQGWMYHANLMLTLARIGRTNTARMFWNIRRGLDDLSRRSIKTQCVIRANRSLSWWSNGILYCSKESKQQHEDFGFCERHSYVVENGFDTNRFSFSERGRRTVREELGLYENDIVIGCIARYDVAKGHMFLIEAFAGLVNEGFDVKLILVGRGVTDQNDEIVEALSALGLMDRVYLLGERGDVENIYSALDIYCSPSINEGFPNVISEAMSVGIPCVVTDTGASRRLVADSGKVVEAGQVAPLKRALKEMLALNARERWKLGQRSRKLISTQYGLESAVGRYSDIYSQALQCS